LSVGRIMRKRTGLVLTTVSLVMGSIGSMELELTTKEAYTADADNEHT